MNNTCFLQGKDTRFKRNDPHKFPSAANYSPKHNGNRSPEIKFGKGQRGNQESPNKLQTPGPGSYENPDTMNKTLFSFGNKSTYQYCETTPGPDHQDVPEQPKYFEGPKFTVGDSDRYDYA